MAYIRKTSDNNRNVILSGNAGKIEYLLESENDSIRVSVGNLDARLNAIVGSASTMDLAEILESLPLAVPTGPGITKLSDVSISRFNYNPGIDIDSLQERISFSVLKGYIFRKGTYSEEYTSILQGRFLTQRERISVTYKDFPELVSVLCENGNGGKSFSASVTVYRSNGSTSNALIGSISPSAGYYIWTFQAGWNHIKTLVSSPSNITGWRITMSNIGWIQFNLGTAPLRTKCFAFRNSLGGIDTIHTLGDFRSLPSSNPKVFINDGLSSVLNMNPVTEYEAASGPIVNAEQREKWRAFLLSPAKYIYTKADRYASSADLVPIILTESSPKLTEYELSDLTFKFRFDYERGGRIYQHS